MPRLPGGGGGPPPPKRRPPTHPINDRAGSLPPGFVKENPLTATRLVLSNIPTSVLRSFGAGLTRNYDWMKSQSGPGAMFMAARARAYTVNDPEMQKVSLGVINSLQTAIEREHELEQQAAGQPVSRLRASENIQAQGSFSYNNNGVRVEVDPTHKIVTLPTNDMQDPVFKQAVQTLHDNFPDWQVQTVSSNSNVRALHDVVGMVNKGFDAAIAAPSWVIDQTAGRLPVVGGPIKTATQKYVSASTTVFGRATDLLSGSIAQTGYYLTGNFHPIPKDWWWPDQPGTAFGNGIADTVPTDPLHDPLGLTHHGLSPNDPARQTVVDTANLTAALVVAHGLGEFARGLKSGRTAVTPDVLSEKGVGQFAGKDVVSGGTEKARGFLEDAGRQLSGRPISRWGDTKLFSRTLPRVIDDAKAKYGDKAGVVLTRRFGDKVIPEELANIIDRHDNGADASSAILRYAQNAPDTPMIGKLNERLGAIKRELRGDLRTEKVPMPPEPPPTESLRSAPPATLAPLQSTRGGHISDLSRVTQTLYREVSPQEAEQVLQGAGSGLGAEEHFASNDPALALGQGANQGVILRFRTLNLGGKISDAKPAWREAYYRGSAEFTISDRAKTVAEAVDQVEMRPPLDAREAAYQKKLRSIYLKDWVETQLDDGTKMYSRPGAEKIAHVEPQTYAQRINDLKAEKGQIEDQLLNIGPPGDRAPITKLPSYAAVHKLRLSESKIGQIAHWMYVNPNRVGPHFSRLFDSVGQTVVRNRFGLAGLEDPDLLRKNAETLREKLNRFGVPEALVDSAVDQLNKTTDSEQHFQVMRRVGSLIAKEGRYLSADSREHIGRLIEEQNPGYYLRAQIERDTVDPTTGKAYKSSEGVLPSTTEDGRYDLPSQSAEMLGDFHLPSAEATVEATSLTRQMVRYFRNHKITAPLGFTIDAMFFLSRVLTAYSKVAILAPRAIPYGALFWRIQGEQALREKLYGYRIFSDETLARWLRIKDTKTKDFHAPTQKILNAKIENWANGHSSFYDLGIDQTIKREEDGTLSATVTVHRRNVEDQKRARNEVYNQNLGSLMLNFEQGPPTAKDWRSVQMIDPVTRSLSDEGARAAYQRIVYRAQSIEQRKLVELNGNVDAWVKWMNGDILGRKVKRMFNDVVAKADLGDLKGDARFKEWGRRSYEAIKQETGGNEGLLEAIRTGTWKRRPETIEAIESYDGQLADRYRNRQDDLATVRSALDDAFYARTDDVTNVRIPGTEVQAEGVGRHNIVSARGPGKVLSEDSAQAALIRSLSDQKKQIIDELDAIEKEAGIKSGDYSIDLLAPTQRSGYLSPKKQARVGFGTQDQFMESLKDAYYSGDYKPPQTLNGWVKKVDDAAETKAGVADRMRAWQGTSLYGMLSNLTKNDMKFTRGSLFTKITAEEYRRLRGLGYTDTQAFAHAKAYAARTTTDIMYDLTDRTSAQRALRNLFWFAPAYQELLTTWFVKIPSKYYWPVGAGVMITEAHAILGLMKEVGLIQSTPSPTKGDPNATKDVIVVPGLGQALTKLTGSKVPDTVFGYTSGLSLLSAGFPSPSIQGQLILEAAAKMAPNSHVAQALNEWIHQYSPATRSIPGAITYAWEATFGTRFPGEFLHPAYQDQLVALGHNAAMDQARASMIQAGNPPPISPGEPGSPYPDTGKGKNAYLRDQAAYRKELLSKANGTYRWWSAISLLGATLSPMSLHVTDAYRQDATKYYNSLFDSSKTADAAQVAQAKQEFVAAHPGGIGYITSKSYLTGDGPKHPYTHPSQDSVYQQMYDGVRKAFTPAEYFTWLQGQESRRVIIGHLQEELNKIGPTAQDRLLHRYDRNAAIAEYHRSWDQYVWANDEPPAPGQRSFLDMWNDRKRIYEKLGVTPTQDFAVSQAVEAYRLIDEYKGHFEPNGLSNSSYETIRAEFAKLMSEGGQFGAPSGAAAKGMAWYMDKVYGPYLDHLQPLYQQATDLAAQGKDPSTIYDEIRRYQEKYTRLSETGKILGPDGSAYPDPQAVAFGNKSPAQQREDAIHYATEPIPWLTSFQRNQAGYDKHFKVDPKDANKFFAYQAWLDSWLQKYEDAHGIVSYSTYGQELQKWRTQSLGALAQGNYPSLAKQNHITGSDELLRLFRVSEGPPIGRLTALGYGHGEPGYQTFNQIAQAAKQANDAITKAGYSPSGDSAYAIEVKKWFYNIVDTARKQDPGYDSLMKDLSLALPIKDAYREGPLLYQAVYFDNFATKVSSVYYKTPAQGVGPYNVQKWERTYSNGKVPNSAMTNIGRGYELQPAAADAFMAAQSAAEQDGVNLLAGVTSAYRSYAEQASPSIQNSPYGAAAPGTSNHGYGLAIDVSEGSKAWRWLMANGSRYGWAHRSASDAVHFTFDLAPGV